MAVLAAHALRPKPAPEVDTSHLYAPTVSVREQATIDVARARAQILFWTFLGFALSDQPLPPDRQQAVLDELLQIVER